MNPLNMSRELLGRILLLTTLFSLLWWILVEGDGRAWGVGVVTVVAAVVVSLRAWPAPRGRLSVMGLVAFLGFFLLHSVRGGVTVAALALRPRMRIRPEFREFRPRLPPGAARVVLADTLSLLPGTVSVGLNGDCLRLHVLDRDLVDEVALRAVEVRIARVFGLELDDA
ncbi:MAG: Na+/H+ antiporter subunit E [Thiotrichales bacterium]